MKKNTFLLVFSLFFLLLPFNGFAQDTEPIKAEDSLSREKKFHVSFGVNTVNNTGKQTPFKDTREWAFENSYSLGVEYRFSNFLALEQSFNLNSVTTPGSNEGRQVTEDEKFDYFSANLSLKYYIGEHFLNSKKLDLYLSGGQGYLKIEDSLYTTSLGGGILYWFSNNLGFRLQGLGILAMGSSDDSFNHNHYQYFTELVYRF